MSQRLLHIGASASNIIHTYISTIKVLAFIEQSGEGQLEDDGQLLAMSNLLHYSLSPIPRLPVHRPRLPPAPGPSFGAHLPLPPLPQRHCQMPRGDGDFGGRIRGGRRRA